MIEALIENVRGIGRRLHVGERARAALGDQRHFAQRRRLASSDGKTHLV